MRPDGVVVPPPGFVQDLCLSQGVEDLAIQELVAHRAIEAFTVAVLPRATWSDVERLHADLRQPLLHGIGDELGAVV